MRVKVMLLWTVSKKEDEKATEGEELMQTAAISGDRPVEVEASKEAREVKVQARLVQPTAKEVEEHNADGAHQVQELVP